VDLDRYIARNEPTWQRLEELSGRARRGLGRLGPGEVEELVQLYQRTSAHLSYVRTYIPEPALVSRLTQLVASANGVIYRRRSGSARSLVQFFSLAFPGAVYHCRRFAYVAAAALFVPALALGIWLSHDADALDRSASAGARHEYVRDQFEQYYSDESPLTFFAHVTTNNIQVSFRAYALGAISGGLGGLAVLAVNGASVGQVAAWMTSEGELARFLGFIVPHGALELTSIVLAGAAGLAVGWALIAPGDRRRADALREEGQRSITIVLGLMAFFVAAGLVEGFITGRGLPPVIRVALGLVVWVAFVGYLAGRGRAAAAAGITGLLGERPRTWDDEPDRWALVGSAVPGP
jgi:uncharacterized membrane protein SpoIIM required for sporulation